MGERSLMRARPMARTMRVRTALVLVATGALAGCATAPASRYAWGSYEEQIYTLYAKPGQLTPEMQADQLQKDREMARATNQKLPPGWHAHLARVYYQMGRAELALEELAAEKTAFPESTTFVDRLTANMTGRGALPPPAAGSPQ
jgi:hypothetical protein